MTTAKPAAKAAPKTSVKPVRIPAAATAAARAAKAAATAKPAGKAAAKAVAQPVVAEKASAEKQAPKAYRLLTGIDDENFCARVSEALANGYELYGSPSITANGGKIYAAQAILLKPVAKKKKKK